VQDDKGGLYSIRQYSLGTAKSLMKIIADPSINYNKLVQSTKYYYNTTKYKLILSNYISKAVWRDAYDNYGAASKESNLADGANRWETE
jgi:hypothetical protein